MNISSVYHDFCWSIERGTGYDLHTKTTRTDAEQAKILREEIIPFLKRNYSIKFPSNYTPTTFDKFFLDIVSFSYKRHMPGYFLCADKDEQPQAQNSTKVIRSQKGYEETLFLEEYTDLAESIEESRNELSGIFESIEENRNGLFEDLTKVIEVLLERSNKGQALKRKSRKEAISGVYELLRNKLNVYDVALHILNNNQHESLKLTSMLAKLEVELYSLDDSKVKTNEFRRSIIDWCRKQNIKEEDTQKLLYYSFQRSLIIRDNIDKIRKMRKEFQTRIAALESKFDKIEFRMEQYVEKVCNELNSISSNSKKLIEETITEQDNALKQPSKTVLPVSIKCIAAYCFITGILSVMITILLCIFLIKLQ